jgi:gas vesicle protein
MNTKSKLFLTFAAGAAIGALATALFTTEKGKKAMQTAKTGLDEFGNELKSKINEFEQELADSLKKFNQKQNPPA